MKLHLQFATDQSVPTQSEFESWLKPLHDLCGEDHEILVRVVDEPEMTELNERYRSKSGPTNVLSFPFESPPGVDLPILGDVVICAPVVHQQAAEQLKQAPDHWAHLLIHGGLHLLGYDHMTPEEAEEMESIEIRMLQQLGIENPYQ